MIQCVVGVEASCSLGRNIIGCSQLNSTGKTLYETVVFRQYTHSNIGELAGHDPILDMTEAENDIERRREAVDRKFNSMAKVHNCFEIWKHSQNLHATPKESRAQNKPITTKGYIPDTEQIVKASWTNFQNVGAAAFKLSERSPLPPALPA